MAFWLRYSVLILLSVLGPLGLGFYFDTQSELKRAQVAGEVAAEAAEPALNAQVTLHAHELVGKALNAAQAIGDDRLIPSARATLRPDAAAKVVEIVARELPAGGFAWVLDDAGTIVVRDKPVKEEGSERITGHPLFVSTQLGFALDGFWRSGDVLYYVGAAPLVKDGEARGAVFVGEAVDQRMVSTLGKGIGTDLSVLLGKDIVASTLPSDIAAAILANLDEGNTDAPVLAGRLAEPLGGAALGFLPLFVAKDAEGMAYASVARNAPGSAVRWVLSADSAKNLRNLPERQQIILGVFASAFLVALVFGLMLRRSYVRPIDTLVDHLSELQQGRGEREMSESATAKPFRRLVKLINMTVQRIPASNFGAGAEGGRNSLDVGEPAHGSNDLGLSLIPSLPPSAGPAGPELGEAPMFDIGGSPSLGAPPTPATMAPPQSGATVPPAVGATMPPSRTQSTASARAGSGFGGPAVPLRRLESSASLAVASADGAAEGQSRKPRSASEIRGVPSTSIGSERAASGVGVPARGQSARPVNDAPAPPETSAQLLSFLEDLREPPESRAGATPFQGTTPLPGSRMGGSAAGGFGSAGLLEEPHPDNFRSEATLVAAPNDYLLQASARDGGGFENGPDRTVVADIPEDLLAEARADGEAPLDSAESAHFKETYERFIEMRRQCGEPTTDLAFDRFVSKLRKNRDGLIRKYNCRTVRFQVYEKDGKAALKATPVRA
ncbi:MAG: hypothetical protein IT384_07495 [Deltaproteobacteria bacterium]|nr:hypothetical protein [Deltaproteobacteria bacterium]